MTDKRALELAAGIEIDGQKAFEAEFAPTTVKEIIVEFDPKHSQPPLCRLTNAEGHTEEAHLQGIRFREGRHAVHFKDPKTWSKISVTTSFGRPGKLLRVKLIGSPPGGTPPPQA